MLDKTQKSLVKLLLNAKRVTYGRSLGPKEIEVHEADYDPIKVKFENVFSVLADVDVKYNKDAFGIEAYAKLDMIMSYKKPVALPAGVGATWFDGGFNYEKENGTALFFKTKITYAFDPCTVYFYFKDTNLLSSTFAADIRLGAKGSVGSANWDICGKIETGKGGKFNTLEAGNKVNFSIPARSDPKWFLVFSAVAPSWLSRALFSMAILAAHSTTPKSTLKVVC
jgi:hypothetical protein